MRNLNPKGFAGIVLVLTIVILKAPTPTPANPSTQTNANSEWKVFQDGRYAFQFSYPAKWRVEHPRSTARLLILRDETNNEMITVDTGVNLAVIGISYCGAYPQDKRCETLKTQSGSYVTIDWNGNGKATAMFSSRDGTHGVNFTLQIMNSATKAIFRKVLSTFKFAR